MADQLRNISCTGPRAESVNLDNLFDFLADVPAQRGAPDGQPAHQPTIAEIGDDMERLADDLDQEVCMFFVLYLFIFKENKHTVVFFYLTLSSLYRLNI